jgi:hypothetical protein
MTDNQRPCASSQIVDDVRRIGHDVKQLLRKLGPSEEASGHFRSARVEFLKGMRQLIDDRIDYISRKPTAGTAGAQGAKVTVE